MAVAEEPPPPSTSDCGPVAEFPVPPMAIESTAVATGPSVLPAVTILPTWMSLSVVAPLSVTDSRVGSAGCSAVPANIPSAAVAKSPVAASAALPKPSSVLAAASFAVLRNASMSVDKVTSGML